MFECTTFRCIWKLLAKNFRWICKDAEVAKFICKSTNVIFYKWICEGIYGSKYLFGYKYAHALNLPYHITNTHTRFIVLHTYMRSVYILNSLPFRTRKLQVAIRFRFCRLSLSFQFSLVTLAFDLCSEQLEQCMFSSFL